MQISDITALAIGGVIVAVGVVYLVINQKKKVIEWLKYAVTEAEKQLGGKTGQLKLRLCYDWFVEKFPAVAVILPFKVFSAWVDTALDTFRDWLKDNKSVANYVEG